MNRLTIAGFWLTGLCLIVLTGCIPVVFHEAETPQVRGLVLDGVSGKPLADARVVLVADRRPPEEPRVVSGVSDSQGRFVLDEERRRYLTLLMPGSYLARFPLWATHEDHARPAHGVASMIGRARAGETDVRTVLLMLPPATEPLPQACQELDSFHYALSAVERLPEWRQQDWFREQVLDSRMADGFLDGLQQMLYHASPDCATAPGFDKRLETARNALSDFISDEAGRSDNQ